MRKVLLLISHLGSGSQIIYQSLNQHPKIQGYKRTGFNAYSSLMDFVYLINCKHKTNNSSAIYMDEILYNFCLSTKDCYNFCKFIYIIRSPEETLKYLVSKLGYRQIEAQRYYLFRLRRICEMAKRTPGALLLDYNSIQDSGPYIQDYLKLKEAPILNFQQNLSLDCSLSFDLLQKTSEAFEKYLYFLNHQNLNKA